MAFVLKQAELGTRVAEVCREMAVSEARFFRWKQRLGGLGPSELRISTRNPDAGFTRRGQRSSFGFKAHVAVDLGSDLVRGAILTGADVGDRLAVDAPVQGDQGAVFADRAYDSATRREALANAGIADAIMHRGQARRRLAPWQRWMNAALAPIRGQVERAFGTLKRSYGWRRVR